MAGTWSSTAPPTGCSHVTRRSFLSKCLIISRLQGGRGCRQSSPAHTTLTLLMSTRFMYGEGGEGGGSRCLGHAFF